MGSTRRAFVGLLSVALSGCAGDRTDESDEGPPTSTESASPDPTRPAQTTGEDATPTRTFELPPAPEPTRAALDRWCTPATGITETSLSVLGEALGADRNVSTVGFTGDGELRTDAPEVVAVGVIDGAAVGAHAYLADVEFTESTLTLTVEEGYRTETGTRTEYGMSMGVRYVARASTSGGFPEEVRVRHHDSIVSRVAGPCR